MTPDSDELERMGRRLLQLADLIRGGDGDGDARARPGTPVPDPSTCEPPSWLVAAGAGRAGRPVPLQGTPRQVAWADRLRRARLSYIRHRGDTRALAAFGVIRDATWWIANAETPIAEVKWPTREQIELPLATADRDDDSQY